MRRLLRSVWFGFPAQLKVPESVLRVWTSRRTVSLWLGPLKAAEKIHRRYIKDGRSQRGSDLGAIPPRSSGRALQICHQGAGGGVLEAPTLPTGTGEVPGNGHQEVHLLKVPDSSAEQEAGQV